MIYQYSSFKEPIKDETLSTNHVGCYSQTESGP